MIELVVERSEDGSAIEPVERELTAEEIDALLGSVFDRKAALLGQLADIRWRRTLTFDYDGETEVPADPALSVITSLAVADQLAPAGETARTFKLKSPAVFRQWTIAQIVAYGMAIGVHVQACFDRESALAAAIETAADHDALNALDLTAGWPA